MKNKKRINVDFSKHQHSREIFTNEKGKEIIVDHFKVPDTYYGYIKFTNTDDSLLVTGDYGNWVFNRPFVPEKENFVSDSYWLEKLRMSSQQRFEELDWDYIDKEIKFLIKKGLKEYGYSGEKLKQAKEWFSELLEECGDKLSYEAKAYRDCYMPDFIDYDMIPYHKEIPAWLLIVFDAFDEICRRIKKQELNEREVRV